MTENTCRYGDDREERLLAYLYDELDASSREAFETHLDACDRCRDELAGFRAVRTQLAAWTPPVFTREPSLAGQSPVVNSRQPWWQAVPVWAQVAAALLVLGVSAGIANLNVHYDRSGLTVRTGWSAPASAAPANAREASAPAAAASATAASAAAPWRPDLTALEHQLRTEFRASTVAQPAPANDAEVLRRVRTMIDESERKQQRDLALRVAEVMRDVDVQRRADLTRISQSLGQIQSNTGMEVMKQRQLLNYLVTVSQKQP